MRERDTQMDVNVETGLEESATRRESTDSDTVRSRTRKRAQNLVSPRSVVVAVVLMIAGSFVFGAVPLLGTVGELLGIAAAGFVYGVGTDARRYFELVVAGAIVGGGSVLLGNLLFALFGGFSMVAVGALGGAIAGAVGHYFGRDLRDGLTRDLGEGPPS